MLRARFSILAGSLSVLAVAACSENPNELKTPGDGRPAIAIVVNPTETLDQSVKRILALFPKGLETAATARWANVKRQYAAGLTDPAQMRVAKQMLFELSDWMNKKAPDMAAPPDNETKTAASARAVLYMSMYVYTGPETSTPSFSPSADAVVGLVTPAAAATIVTPTKHAGVQLEAGSVAENTIVVITQNPTPYPANCSGPLQTRLCQYPQFYTFDEFPHKRLLKPAKFSVCHVNTGENRYPLADHNRFRLAHGKPADPADYTPGSTIRDQNGESIEILPLIAQTFSTCVGNFYAKNTVPGGILSRFARGIQNIITPRTAYAIDLGLGGLSVDFSPFNDVDPLGLPDLIVQSMSVAPTSVLPGAHVTLSYGVNNVGTAIGAPVSATIFLTPPAVEGPPPTAQQIGSITVPSLVPGATDTRTDVVVAIPQQLPPGTYNISLVVGSDPVFPDTDPTNNTASAVLTIIPAVSAQNFTTTGSLNVARLWHTATLLNNGMILIAGGQGPAGNTTASAELYNPATGIFSTTGSMTTARNFHTATLLDNGMVLIAGGGNNTARLASAELYDPVTGTFSATGNMTSARNEHTATLLHNGMVLIAGGGGLNAGSNFILASAELYDPATGIFSTTGSMTTGELLHTATLLNNGMVLIAGGIDPTGTTSARGQLYNPASGTFMATGRLNTARVYHTATLLNNGMALIAGGTGSPNTLIPLAGAELYNPATGVFTATGSLNTARHRHTATLLNNGTVLFAGGSQGFSGINSLASAELYDPATAAFAATGSLNTGRQFHKATLLNNGLVLITGGTGGSSAELYGTISPP
jgi:CARDB/Galactose oxidase, central domain